MKVFIKVVKFVSVLGILSIILEFNGIEGPGDLLSRLNPFSTSTQAVISEENFGMNTSVAVINKDGTRKSRKSNPEKSSGIEQFVNQNSGYAERAAQAHGINPKTLLTLGYARYVSAKAQGCAKDKNIFGFKIAGRLVRYSSAQSPWNKYSDMVHSACPDLWEEYSETPTPELFSRISAKAGGLNFDLSE